MLGLHEHSAREIISSNETRRVQVPNNKYLPTISTTTTITQIPSTYLLGTWICREIVQYKSNSRYVSLPKWWFPEISGPLHKKDHCISVSTLILEPPIYGNYRMGPRTKSSYTRPKRVLQLLLAKAHIVNHWALVA